MYPTKRERMNEIMERGTERAENTKAERSL